MPQFEFLLWTSKPTPRGGPQIGWRAPLSDYRSTPTVRRGCGRLCYTANRTLHARNCHTGQLKTGLRVQSIAADVSSDEIASLRESSLSKAFLVFRAILASAQGEPVCKIGDPQRWVGMAELGHRPLGLRKPPRQRVADGYVAQRCQVIRALLQRPLRPHQTIIVSPRKNMGESDAEVGTKD